MSQTFFTLSPNIRGKNLSQMWLLVFLSFQMAITWKVNKCQLVDFIQRLVGSAWERLRKGSGADIGCHVLASGESIKIDLWCLLWTQVEGVMGSLLWTYCPWLVLERSHTLKYYWKHVGIFMCTSTTLSSSCAEGEGRRDKKRFFSDMCPSPKCTNEVFYVLTT